MREARLAIRQLTQEIVQSICTAPEIEQKMEQLVGQLETVKGQAGTGAARPAGGEPVQGDPVRESGIKGSPYMHRQSASARDALCLCFVFIAPGYRICFTINPWRLQ